VPQHYSWRGGGLTRRSDIKRIHGKYYNIRLDKKDGWVLNHYANPENNYLGYLILGTLKHYEDFKN